MKGMKTGGRQKGTPNKENPLKGFIKAHSLSYFTQQSVVCEDGSIKLLPSQFDEDLESLEPEARVNAELRLLEFHTPKMKAVDVEMAARITLPTIEDKLRALCAGEDTDNEIDN